MNGLTGYRFEFGDEALGAPLKSTSNECFCVKSDPDARERMCSLDGVMDISACSKGAPIVISLPHFLDGSKSLVSSINGLRPQREVHQSFFDVDPVSVYPRISLNIQMLRKRVFDSSQEWCCALPNVCNSTCIYGT